MEGETFEQHNQSEFYPFYIAKKRTSLGRRRSSVQSWNQRHKFKLVRRLVRKSGKSSIHQKSSTERSFRFLLDISNTLLESSWISTLFVVIFIFVLTWVMFAGFWAIISIENVEAWNGTSDSCLDGIESFTGYLLFSIETQTTIGYGGRYINESCPEAIIGLCIQLIIGAAVCGSLVCIVFLKMVGPLRNPHSMVCFSRRAVICQRDGELCLIFRVRDYDMRYECHTRIVAYLAEERSGELSLKALKLEPTGILIWPVEVIHRIDGTSPFWDLSAKDLILKRFEIIVVMEGECLATSYMSSTTTSYLSREIRWGGRFVSCIHWDKETKKYVVDHKKFNKTEEVTIPLCSAQRLAQVFDDIVLIASPSSGRSLVNSTSSPIVTGTVKKIVDEVEEESSSGNEEEETRIVMVVAADVHRRSSHREDSDSGSSISGVDAVEYSTFMDLSVEDLEVERRQAQHENSDGVRIRSRPSSETRPRTVSDAAKDILLGFKKYMSASSSKNRTSRKYEETDF